MTNRLLRITCFIALAAACAVPASAADPIRLLIVDGQNNHNWAVMTPFMKSQLEATGRFQVDVATSPPKGAAPEEWTRFQPNFDKYQTVLSNYNGEMWPEGVRKAFVEYVRNGGGVVIIHAANNSFPGWKQYDEMIGLGWRKADYGPRVYLDDAGQMVRVPAGEDVGAGHGAQHEFQITIRNPRHPVTQGMPEKWMHATDELYHGQRGPAKNMRILATAYSSPDVRGTGKHEPMIWWIPYGKGKVFTTMMGHVSGNNIPGIQCVGFVTVMNRACEWVATDEVTIPIPDNFPTATEVRLVDE